MRIMSYFTFGITKNIRFDPSQILIIKVSNIKLRILIKVNDSSLLKLMTKLDFKNR